MKAVHIFRKRPVIKSYDDARHHLLRQLQHKNFFESIRYLEKGKKLDKRDKLLQYTPFLDKDGLIRAPWADKDGLIWTQTTKKH